VPLQHNYNQKVIICYKTICNVPYTLSTEKNFGFLGNKQIINTYKKDFSKECPEDIWGEKNDSGDETELENRPFNHCVYFIINSI